ncbi:MAG: precorrin-2 C(20)-methyltransferase [Hungatella sp.]
MAVQAVPEILGKQLVCVDIPMTKDAACIAKSHREGIALLAACLEEGKHVALLTLGDSLIYASSMYLLEGIKALGYETEAVSGIPSFCAAAARFQIPLVKNSEELHILPASYQIDEGLKLPGVKVLMKAGSRMQEVKQQLLQGSYEVAMVENCGMPGERIARSAKDIPEDAGYYSLMIVRNAD